MIQSCKCKTCKKVRAMIKHIEEMSFETISMNKQRYLEEFQDLIK